MPASSSSPESRGTGWVVAQFGLLGLIAVGWVVGPRWPDDVSLPLAVAGAAVAVVGAALVVWARRTLGRAFTAFPEPRPGASVVTNGPYRFARHPMYGGALLLLGGLSLTHSVGSLVGTGALGVLWWRKSVEEERRLAEAHPDYDAYRRRTPRRFVPFVA
jgi:protein-S-isoprenylcysteine O-methyltransferase Ste14